MAVAVELLNPPTMRFGLSGIHFRELGLKTRIRFERAVPISPNARCTGRAASGFPGSKLSLPPWFPKAELAAVVADALGRADGGDQCAAAAAQHPAGANCSARKVAFDRGFFSHRR
jgi:hypothetical protein